MTGVMVAAIVGLFFVVVGVVMLIIYIIKGDPEYDRLREQIERNPYVHDDDPRESIKSYTSRPAETKVKLTKEQRRQEEFEDFPIQDEEELWGSETSDYSAKDQFDDEFDKGFGADKSFNSTSSNKIKEDEDPFNFEEEFGFDDEKDDFNKGFEFGDDDLEFGDEKPQTTTKHKVKAFQDEEEEEFDFGFGEEFGFDKEEENVEKEEVKPVKTTYSFDDDDDFDFEPSLVKETKKPVQAEQNTMDEFNDFDFTFNEEEPSSSTSLTEEFTMPDEMEEDDFDFKDDIDFEFKGEEFDFNSDEEFPFEEEAPLFEEEKEEVKIPKPEKKSVSKPIRQPKVEPKEEEEEETFFDIAGNGKEEDETGFVLTDIDRRLSRLEGGRESFDRREIFEKIDLSDLDDLNDVSGQLLGEEENDLMVDMSQEESKKFTERYEHPQEEEEEEERSLEREIEERLKRLSKRYDIEDY